MGMARARRLCCLASLERLEDRVQPAAMLDIVGGVLVYVGSGVNNNLSISETAPLSGQYFFNDTGETITLGAGAMAATWTGNATNTVQGPVASVNSMLVNTDGGNDIVTLLSLSDPIGIDTAVGVPDVVNIGNAGNVDGVLATVNVQDTGGVGQLNINDFNNPSAKNITFDNTLTATISGVLPGGFNINYGAGVTEINFNGSFGGNTINVNLPTDDTLGVLNLNSGDGSDTVKVARVNPGLALNINTQVGGADATTIGNGTLDNILGVVSVQDAGGVSTLTLDDSTDSSGRNVTFTNGQITGATPNPITYEPGVTTLVYNGGTGADTLNVNIPGMDDLETFNLNGGDGPDTVNVRAVKDGLTVNVDTQAGIPDVTNIGSNAPNLAASVLSTILGTVNVTDSAGAGALNISDAANAGSEDFQLSASQLTSSAFAGLITYGSGITDLRIDGGPGGNSFLVTNTRLGTNTLINSGNGDDVVDVVATTGPLTIQAQNGQDQANLGNGGLPGLPGTVQNIKGLVTLRKTGVGVLDSNIDDTNHFGVTNAFLRINTGTGFSELTGQAPATIRYFANELGTLAIHTGPSSDSVNVNFDNGNPIPFGPTNLAGGLDYMGQGDGLLNLFNDLPTGPFSSEQSTATGSGQGDINFVDSLSNNTHVHYSGLSPVNDTTSVASYTFTTPAFPAQSVSILDTVVNGFNGTRIIEASNVFERQDISNKQNVTINVGSPLTLFPIDVNIRLDNPNATAGAHNTALQTMTINSFVGKDFVQIINTPKIPNVSVTTDGGDDTVFVNGPGVPAGTFLFLDGGPGIFDTLNYDAGGTAVIAVPGPGPNEVFILGPNGPVDAINFEQITITNVAPAAPVLNAPLVVNTVEGFQLVDVDVATFTSPAPGAKASDFTATIDWGDGTPTTGGVIVQDASVPTLFHVRGTHIYHSQGLFTVKTTLASTGSTSTTIVNGVPVTIITGPSGPIGPTASANVTVSNAPLVLTVNPLSGVEGAPIPTTVVATFIDQGGIDPANPNPAGDYTATIDWGDGTVDNVPAADIQQIGNTNQFRIRGSHTYQEEGTFAVKVTVTNNDSPLPHLQVAASAPAFIADAPLTTPLGVPVSATEGAGLTDVQVFTFVDTNPSAAAADFTATIDWGDGTLSLGTVSQTGGAGTPFQVKGNHTYTEEGSYTIKIQVNDDGGATISGSAQATVKDALLTTPVGLPVPAVEGQLLSAVAIGKFTDVNPFATAGDFTVSIDWGDSTPLDTTTGVVTLVGGNAAGAIFQVSGNHTFNSPGSFTIKITVTDKGGSTVMIQTIAGVANASLSSDGATVTGTEGLPLSDPPASDVLVATFQDADPSALAADFTATINWGDGSAATSGTITAVGTPNGVVFRVRGTHTYHEEGTYAVTVTISDGAGATTIAHGQAVVADAPLTTPIGVPVSATAGAGLTDVQVFTFVDTNPFATAADFTATIDWGDGTLSLGTVSQTGALGTPFQVKGNHTYAQDGSFTIKVQVHDVGGATISGSSTATVKDASLTSPIGLPVSAEEGLPLLDVPLGTFIDTNKLASAGDFSVSIDWGDGTPLDTTTGVVTLAGGNAAGIRFRVTGSHTFATEGTSPITVSVTDAGGSTITITTTASVFASPLTAQGATVTGTEGLPLSNVLVATFTDDNPLSVAGDFTATINWGDGTSTSAGTITKVGSANGAQFRVTGSHTYAEEGTHDVTVTIVETVGGTQAFGHGSAVIGDAPLSPGVQPLVNANEGAPFNGVVATFLDANTFAPAADFQAVIDWGDNTPTTLGTVTQTGPGQFAVSGSHLYADSGVNGGIGSFPITVQVVDRGGATVTLNNIANVADRALAVNGIMNRSADSGISNVDGITNVPRVSFFGFTSEAGASVFLYAQRLASAGVRASALTLIGQGVADASRRWDITSNFLNDGRYSIFVQAIDSSGKTISSLAPVALPNGVVAPLTIDTVGPKVTNVAFARLSGQVVVTFKDELSGMNQRSLIDANNYVFNKVQSQPIGTFKVNRITTPTRPPLSTLPQVVTLTINQARQIRGGFYLFTVKSASSKVRNGIQDVAGNALDGEFYRFFPSGNNVRGGDFVAELDAKHNIIFAPKTVIGVATPVSPPGTLSTGSLLNQALQNARDAALAKARAGTKK